MALRECSEGRISRKDSDEYHYELFFERSFLYLTESFVLFDEPMKNMMFMAVIGLIAFVGIYYIAATIIRVYQWIEGLLDFIF